jgi:Predicted transcriptional regulators
MTKEAKMNLFIDNKSGIPIYEQIYSQIKNLIINGELAEDMPLPSIRNLAKDLHISVITTKRAYDELEKEGFIYTVAAKGCFVAPKNIELLREENLKKIEGHLQDIITLAASCNLKEEDIISMLHLLYEEE